MHNKKTYLIGLLLILIAIFLTVYVAYRPLQRSQDSRSEALAQYIGEFDYVARQGLINGESEIDIFAGTRGPDIYGIQYSATILGSENIEILSIEPNNFSPSFTVQSAFIEQNGSSDPKIRVLVIGKNLGSLFTTIDVDDGYHHGLEKIATLKFRVKNAGSMSLSVNESESMMLTDPNEPDGKPEYEDILERPAKSYSLVYTDTPPALSASLRSTDPIEAVSATAGEEESFLVDLSSSTDGIKKIGNFQFIVTLPKSQLVGVPIFTTSNDQRKNAKSLNIDNIDETNDDVDGEGNEKERIRASITTTDTQHIITISGNSKSGLAPKELTEIGTVRFVPASPYNTGDRLQMQTFHDEQAPSAVAFGLTNGRLDTTINYFSYGRSLLSYTVVPASLADLISDTDLLTGGMEVVPAASGNKGKFDIQFAVKNIGSSFEDNFDVYIYADSVKPLTVDTTSLKSFSLSGLATNGSTGVLTVHEVSLEEGPHEISMWFDRDNKIAELNETNNQITIIYNVLPTTGNIADICYTGDTGRVWGQDGYVEMADLNCLRSKFTLLSEISRSDSEAVAANLTNRDEDPGNNDLFIDISDLKILRDNYSLLR